MKWLLAIPVVLILSSPLGVLVSDRLFQVWFIGSWLLLSA